MTDLDPEYVLSRTWMAKGLCAGLDPDLFFPVRGANLQGEEAKKVCNTPCPVKAECFEYAVLIGEEQGVWGGGQGPDFRRARKERGISVAAA